ncbi:MAG: hypothetical protein AAGA45_03175 [Verrucomicrobiota bacterium]
MQHAGFALVLALSLLSLLLLLIISFAALLQVEMAVVQPQQGHHQARANAIVGLHQAVAKLQRTAGPDQRQTARAEILSSTASRPIEHPYWTGVWEQRDGEDVVSWLVSGSAPAPDQPLPTGDTVVLVGGQEQVFAPRVRLGPAGAYQGSCAWWVGDEGVKATFKGIEWPAGIPAEKADALANQLPTRVDLSRLLKKRQNRDAGVMADMDRLFASRQLGLLRNAEGRTILHQSEVGAAYHHYTPRSYGVLENALTGGLMANLADSHYRDHLWCTDELQAFLNRTSAEGIPLARAASRKSADAGQPVDGLSPIPSEVRLIMGIHQDKHSAMLRIRYHVVVEFWNPYAIPIRFPVDEENRAMVICFQGMPEITIEATRSGHVPDMSDDLNDILYYQGTNKEYLHCWLDISPPEGMDAPVLMPGEVYRLTAPNPAVQPEGLARRIQYIEESLQSADKYDAWRWSAARGTLPEADEDIKVELDHKGRKVSILFVPFTGNTEEDYLSLNPLFEIRNLRFDDISYRQRFRSGSYPFSIEKSTSHKIDRPNVIYHWRLNSDSTAFKAWLDSVDPRTPLLDAQASFTDRSGTSRKYEELMQTEIVHASKSGSIRNRKAVFPDRELLHDEDPRTHEQRNPNIALYEMPLSTPVSVAALRHVHFQEEPALSLGNPFNPAVNTTRLNQLLDHYFFSPVLNSGTNTSLLNPQLATLGSENPAVTHGQHDAAGKLLRIGAFNINSTSEQAWRALLGAGMEVFPGQTRNLASANGTPVVSVGKIYHRLPQTNAANPHGTASLLSMQSPEVAYGQGFRPLEASKADAQLQLLAEGIVSSLKQRGRPLTSLAELADSGIIQAAIDEVDEESGMPFNQALDSGSNVYLTQADVLLEMTPAMAVRSDTFVVRAYGEAVDALSGETFRSWCEATVQRLPEKVNGSDPMTPTADVFGRRFQITAFRWLDRDELQKEESLSISRD